MCVASCPSSSPPQSPSLRVLGCHPSATNSDLRTRARRRVLGEPRTIYEDRAGDPYLNAINLCRIQGYREKIKLIDIIGKNKHGAFLCRVSTRSDMGVKHLEILYTFCARLDTFLSINRKEVKKYYTFFFLNESISLRYIRERSGVYQQLNLLV